MTIYVYRSSDTNAPAGMTNVAGSLITVLDGLLINGYSLGTVSSITRSGSTATITFSSSHGLVTNSTYNKVLIAGSDQAEYNGTFRLTVTSSTQATFTVSGTPVTPATGSITCTKPGGGWTKSFSGTNKAVYRPASGSQLYMRIDDTGTISARFRGYETMSDVDTGTGLFPTDVQQSGGLYINKANSATPREWFAIIDSDYIVLASRYDGNTYMLNFFGDYTSLYTGSNPYNCYIEGSTTSGGVPVSYAFTSAPTSAQSGFYAPRSYDGTGTSRSIGRWSNYVYNTTGHSSGTLTSYPDPCTGKLIWGDVYVGLGTHYGIDKTCISYAHPVTSWNEWDTLSLDGSRSNEVYVFVTCYVSSYRGWFRIE